MSTHDVSAIHFVEVPVGPLKFVSVGRDESDEWVSDKEELGVVLQPGL